eukprot:COSAG05_NODE_10905_length_540_cov_0.696145_1_plen_34_part_10
MTLVNDIPPPRALMLMLMLMLILCTSVPRSVDTA